MRYKILRVHMYLLRGQFGGTSTEMCVIHVQLYVMGNTEVNESIDASPWKTIGPLRVRIGQNLKQCPVNCRRSAYITKFT